MKKIHFLNLSSKAVKSLKKIATLKKYSPNSQLHYEGQIPIVAYCILKGNILLLKNGEIYHKLTKGCIIGYRELSLNEPSSFTAEILGETQICYIDNSTLLEIKNSRAEDIRHLHSELASVL